MLIVRIRMGQRYTHLILYRIDKRDRSRLLRRDADEFYESVRRTLEPVKQLYVARNDIPLVLCPLLCLADERSFHINADQLCLICRIRRSCHLLFVSSSIFQYMYQLVPRERHRRR